MVYIVTVLIVTRVASQYYFVRTVDFFVCVLISISGVFTTNSLSLIFIQSSAIEDSCNNLVLPHSV